jgi:copper(I)-binding protein
MMQRTANLLHASLIVLLGVVLAVLVIAGTGCSSPPPQITIEGQYAELSPLFIGSGDLYMTIRNAGGRDKLIGVAASLPRTVIELHDVRDNRMVRIEEIPVPARDTVALKPGSLHIMIFNMPKTIQKGSELSLTLRFQRSGERTVQVLFRKYKISGRSDLLLQPKLKKGR